MATNRKKHRAPVPVFQRDPGPWSRLLIDWLATLAVIMIFGLVMLFSASYTTGYLRMGDSFHYIKQQALCMILGLGCMFLISYVDHRFLRKMVVPGYFIVLAMLAVLRGAERMDAVDIDEWAYRNASENIADNDMADRIRPLLGDRRAIEGKRYDFILANINRNVLLADMDAYAAALPSGGMLFLSGILEADVDTVTDRAQQFGFERLRTRTRSGWAVVRFKKK